MRIVNITSGGVLVIARSGVPVTMTTKQDGVFFNSKYVLKGKQRESV